MDAVLSEDVDTLMFGSGVTLRNWTPENGSGKTPTHVNVYRAEETLKRSGMDGPGMVLVALMSGGDYIPEGIPGCGPKVACDAARAGFGKELCALRRSDKEGLKAWRDLLQHEIRTNESKLFTRKNKNLVIPEDFPSMEVMGYYTRPCISTATKLVQLRESLKWDQDIDFPALRSFTGDAFDWRCVGGAKKFIRNLAPAMLVRRLRLIAESGEELEQEAQAEAEAALVAKVHGKRNHSTTDGELELRISFTPSNLVPIDLSIEDEEDDFLPAGRDENDSDLEDGPAAVPSETPTEASDIEDAPTSPTKKTRQARPYDPDAAEKLWILKDFLQLGCPLLVEDYEASLLNPRETAKAKRKAKTAAGGTTNIHAPKSRAPRETKTNKANDMPANSLMRHMQVTKAASLPPEPQPHKQSGHIDISDDDMPAVSAFKLPSTRVPSKMMGRPTTAAAAPSKPVHDFFASSQPAPISRRAEQQRTPKKSNRLKRPSPELSTPRVARGRADITSYFSPTPKANRTQSQGGVPDQRGMGKEKSAVEVIDLLSSSPMQEDDVAPRDPSPTPRQTRHEDVDDILPPLPDTVTKRRKMRRERGPLRKSLSAPVQTSSPLFMPRNESPEMDMGFEAGVDIDAGIQDLRAATGPADGGNGGLLSRLSDARRQAADADSRPVFHFSPSQHSLPTPPAETTSPAPAPLPSPRHDHDFGYQDNETFGRESFPPTTNREPQHQKLTAPPPTAKPEANHQPIITTTSGAPEKETETITLLSSPAAAPPQAPKPSETEARRRPSPPPSRQQSFQPPSHTAAVAQPDPSWPKPKSKAKSKANAMMLRDSLPGTWRAATDEEAEALDLTGDGSGVRKDRTGGERAGPRRAWRTSGVEVLDLTGS